MHTYLISFQQKTSNEAQSIHSPDLGEKVGQWGMGWLSLGFGKRVKVTPISGDHSSGVIFEKMPYPACQRIIAAVTAILLFPISLLLAGIGCVGLAHSESHAALTTMYINYRALKKQSRQTCVKEGSPENLLPKETLKNVNASPSSSTSSKPTFVQTIQTKEGNRQNLKEIPSECDIRGKKWLNNEDHLLSYATDCLKRVNPNVRYFHTAYLEDGDTQMEWCFEEKRPLPEGFAFCPLVPSGYNHYSLVYICTKTRTIEYYDSKVNYGDYKTMIADLETLAKKFDQNDPGKTSYKVVPKIKKKLQPDAYQCGPWVLYFLEQRAQNSKVDFNELDIHVAQKMIAEFRLQIMDRLIELHKMKNKIYL